MKKTLLGLATAVLLTIPAASANAALNAYLKMKGSKTTFASEGPSGYFQALCDNELIGLIRSSRPDQAGVAPAIDPTTGAPTGAVGVATPRESASGLATGRRMHKPIVITKTLDKASPQLAKAAASGENLPEVTLYLYREQRDGMVDIYIKVVMTNAMISGYSQSSGGDRPMESISFSYAKIAWTKVEGKQKNDAWKYDVKTNNKL